MVEMEMWIMLSMYRIAGGKGSRRRRSRFEVIAVKQLSCGAGDSLTEGMREAQIAIGAPTLVHRDDFQPPSHRPIVQLLVSHQHIQLLFLFPSKIRATKT